ncbi:phosphotransferase enzyme family protein [Catenuloplanes japonicus]|uniref:phosphotransferase enzyme family protein n=1 Tax=Catenuloplanes japonicus TaxID=33876 RepID=UPI000A4A6F99|nr:phosphotransferase [Catenuloplanes japonicus]
MDPEVLARWRLTAGPALGHRESGTWAATRDGTSMVVKYLDDATFPDWPYTLRVADALRAQGWPTPEPVEEPIVVPHGAWALFHRLPGRSVRQGGADPPADQRARGRLLAELHASATATGITAQRRGFTGPAEVVADPALDHRLRVYERTHPAEGAALRKCRESTAAWFADHPVDTLPHSVIHGDFAPWNLLFDATDGRLTGLVDFEGTHFTLQVADFALSWRGYQDEVLRGYDEVRPLSDLEWHAIRPAFHAWLFIGVAQTPAVPGPPPDLAWQVAHLSKHSALLDRKTGLGR